MPICSQAFDLERVTTRHSPQTYKINSVYEGAHSVSRIDYPLRSQYWDLN